MADRVRVTKEVHGGSYSRPWIVFLDGQKLRDGRGGVRRFKTESAARDAGARKQVQQDRLNAADGVPTSDRKTISQNTPGDLS